METHHRILLLDDEPEMLEVFSEILAQLPSRPEIRTTNSGTRALAMLESEPYRLLISDLKMPKMDGLQVLSIVRRRYPDLRTVVLTSVQDEQFRSRVYALGVDLFWQKPISEHEIKMFLESIEALLGRETNSGFRGVQSKSLVDIIQLECISQNSVLLRIINGPLSGKIWINAGELIDAETDEVRGEEAFRNILSWKTGTFETLPADLNRPRTIFKSYNALLLESAQAIDESRGAQTESPDSTGTPSGPATGLAALGQINGVEFVLAIKAGPKLQYEARGIENPEHMAVWARKSLDRFQPLGDRLHVGPIEQIVGFGMQRHVALAQKGDESLCVGWSPLLGADEVHERMQKLLALWDS